MGYSDVKVDALLAHASQYESTMYITDGDQSQRAAFAQRIADELVATG